MQIDPPKLDPKDYGFEAYHINKTLNPRPVTDGVVEAPEFILKLVKCGCASSQACETGNCGCNSR